MSIGTCRFASGKEKHMKTFIIEWNPGGQGYTLTDFSRDIPRLEYGDFPWHIDCLQGFGDIRSGDNFVMIKSGIGEHGIVMRGFFLSDPKTFPRERGYTVCLRPTFMINSTHPKGILSEGDLRRLIPQFDWIGDALVRELPQEIIPRFEGLWDGYLLRFSDEDYDNMLLGRNDRPQAGIEDAVLIAAEALYDVRDKDGRPAILQALREGLSGKNDVAIIIGLLKSVIRGAYMTLGELRERGISEMVVDGCIQQ